MLTGNILQKLLHLIGVKKLTIQDGFPQYDIGKWTYGHPKILSWDEGTVLKIGKFCSLAPDLVILLGGEHRTDWVTTYPFNKRWNSAKKYTGHPTSNGNVVIENDVWVGWGSKILSGVTIGTGACLGAGSVVFNNIEPYSIVAGNPAKVITKRFSDEIIERLLASKWWDLDDKDIEKILHLLMSKKIEEFLKVVDEIKDINS